MKKIQKILFFLGAISLVVFGNKKAIETISYSDSNNKSEIETTEINSSNSPKVVEVNSPKVESKPSNVSQKKLTETKRVEEVPVVSAQTKPKTLNTVQNKPVEVKKKVVATQNKQVAIKTTNKVTTNKATTSAKPVQKKEEVKVENTKKVTTEQSSTKERATSSY